MRRIACLSLCLGLCAGLAGTARAQHGAPVSNHKAPRLNAGPLCDKCVAEMQKVVPADPRDVAMAQSPQGLMMAQGHGAHSDCAACESDAAGVAYVGQGAEAPAYAMVGGATGAPGEPVPIGVMQVGHDRGAVTANNARIDPLMPRQPVAGPITPAPMGQSMSYPGFNRRSVLGHMIGLRSMGGWGREREARRREQHAMIRYDQGVNQVSHVPASSVYGR